MKMMQLRNTASEHFFRYFDYDRYNRIGFLNDLSSIAEQEPHNFGRAGAGAMKRCDSASDSSGIDRFSKMLK
jgi:hypothetical protein